MLCSQRQDWGKDMPCKTHRAAFAGILALSLLTLLPAGAHATCPPSKTWTTGPSDDASVVLVEGAAVEAKPVAGPFDVPWSIAFLPDGSYLITERPGRLQHVKQGVNPVSVSGVPAVYFEKHGGLLDVALDPDFATNGTIYFSYLQGDATSQTTRVMRAHFDAGKEALTEQKVIFEGTPGKKPEQIGGRIAVTEDGYLFLTLGDTWEGSRAQDVGDTAGSIIRIRTDGSIPEDNPFHSRVGARTEIWSYGHRNPQGLTYDRQSHQLWETEHGPQGGDELNLIQRGGNYGWPIATYGVDYSGHPIAINSQEPGTIQPIHYWVPLSVAPSGLAIETIANDRTIWMGTLGGQMVIKLSLVGNCVVSEKHLLKNQLGRIRDIRVAGDGAIYILTDGGRGTLYRLDFTPQTSTDDPGKTHL
jgi:glucose/arabinose dehydrogenase